MGKETDNLDEWAGIKVDGKKSYPKGKEEIARHATATEDTATVEFLRKFLDPSSPTHFNFEESAKGTPQVTIDNFKFLDVAREEMPDAIRRMISLQAELNVMEVLLINAKMEVTDRATGTTREVYDKNLLKIKTEMTKFVKETLDSENYSKKIIEEKHLKVSMSEVLANIEKRNEAERLKEANIVDITYDNNRRIKING